jgi:hypothetical protein
MTRCHETCVSIGIRNKACLLNKEDDGARGASANAVGSSDQKCIVCWLFLC